MELRFTLIYVCLGLAGLASITMLPDIHSPNFWPQLQMAQRYMFVVALAVAFAVTFNLYLAFRN